MDMVGFLHASRLGKSMRGWENLTEMLDKLQENVPDEMLYESLR